MLRSRHFLAVPEMIPIQVYNHLLKPIEVRLLDATRKPRTTCTINARASMLYRGAFFVGFYLQVLVIDGHKKISFFESQLTRIPRELHIGQVTTRLFSHIEDNGVKSVTSTNGFLMLWFHNKTNVPLIISGNVPFPLNPQSVYRYRGTDELGIPYGTVFQDLSGLFPPFELTRPCSDIFWGTVTEMHQPKDGGIDLANIFTENPTMSFL